MKERILVCWLGHTDLRAMAGTLPASVAVELRKRIGDCPPGELGSPIKTLVEQEVFSHVCLLSSYPKSYGEAFAGWLGGNVRVYAVTLKDPTDYPAVYDAATGALAEITKSMHASAYELCIHLSPGTPTMAAIWVLLGKSLYPATFYQTYRGKAKKVDIPFDINMDYLPELNRRREEAIQAVVSNAAPPVGFENIVGKSREIKIAMDRAWRVAASSVSVLILGESGTGKELFARAIHDASPRGEEAFVAINCAAMPRELLESELFGHKKGSFTGAVADHRGAFEQADGGTLFLDEIGECDPAMQAKLLRVLQPPQGQGPCTRVFRPVGGSRDITTDVRLVTATNRSLSGEIGGGRFRPDLYYRLAVVTIQLPPLRARGGDVPLLAEILLEGINTEFRRQMGPLYQDKKLSAGANVFVQSYAWPGNVRELYNLLTQAVVMVDGGTISRADLEAAVTTGPVVPGAVLDSPIPDNFNLGEHIEAIQRAYLARAMAQAGGVKTRAAALLGMKNYQTLDAQLKRFRIAP